MEGAMRWLFELFFLDKLARFFKSIEKPVSESVVMPKPESDESPRLKCDLEPEFERLIELLESQLLVGVRCSSKPRDRTVTIETDDGVIARISIHKKGVRTLSYAVVRLHESHEALRAWFGFAFLGYKIGFSL